MEISIYPNYHEMSQAAADKAAGLLREVIERLGQAVFVVATGASQFGFLEALCEEPGIDWAKTTMFHLDEYAALPETHPASFRRYLKERLIEKVHPGQVQLIQGDAPDLEAERLRLNGLLARCTVDVAFVGIGENGHLAFNDPPADFETEDSYIIVKLDEACRRQQLGEGWFPTLEDVPRRAISMSIRQIMKAHAIVCTVPDQRKAQAVYHTLTGGISPLHPASVLREHPRTFLFLDEAAASLLPK
jgi:glucosamine-6-phosphate deaminase